MSCSSAALNQLNLPPEEQVGLIVDIIKAMPDPGKHPKFLKNRRSQSRPTTLSDFCRPVQSDAERALFMHCYTMHTQSRRTDWFGMVHEYNLEVCKTWQQTHEVADLFLKHKKHLKDYEKHLVMQASRAEMTQTSHAISGLQPSAGSTATSVPARMLQLGEVNVRAPVPGTGIGKGGKGAPKKCHKCSDLFGSYVGKLGHDCFLYMCSKGCTAAQLQQHGLEGNPISPAEAQARLAKKLQLSVHNKKRKTPGA